MVRLSRKQKLGKVREAQRLERFSVGGGGGGWRVVRRVEKSPDSVTGTCDAGRAWRPVCPEFRWNLGRSSTGRTDPCTH